MALAGAGGAHAVGRWLPGQRSAPAAPTAAVATLLLAALVAMHVGTGTLVPDEPAKGLLHVALFAGAWGVSWALLPLLGGASVLAVPAGIALIEADRRALPGLYPWVHLWLGGLGCAAIARGLIQPFERVMRVRFGRGAAYVIVGALVATVVAVAARPAALRDPGPRQRLDRAGSGAWLLTAIPGRPLKPVEVSAAARASLVVEQHLTVPPPKRGMNLLLVTVDALRADVLAPTGAQTKATKARRRRAPRMNRFAEHAVRFRRAYTPAVRTLRAFAAMMTGRYPGHIHYRPWSFKRRAEFDDPKRRPAAIEGLKKANRLGGYPQIDTEDLLAWRIREQGLYTLATPYVTRHSQADAFGYHRGFDDYAELSDRGWKWPTSAKVIDEALLQRAKLAGRRWFHWVHLYDPHTWRGKRKHYNELVRITDTAFGRLLDAINAQPETRDNTVIVLMSDHGEAFGEHRRKRHGTFLHEPQARIPLAIRFPPMGAGDLYEPKEITTPVSAIDVTATLLVLAGADTRGVDGVNLLPLIAGSPAPGKVDKAGKPEAPLGRPLFLENTRYGTPPDNIWRPRDRRGVVVDNLKYTVDRRFGVRALYDLSSDPKESKNLIEQRPDDHARLAAILAAYIEESERAYPMMEVAMAPELPQKGSPGP